MRPWVMVSSRGRAGRGRSGRTSARSAAGSSRGGGRAGRRSRDPSAARGRRWRRRCGGAMAASASTSQRAVAARWSVSCVRERGQLGVGAGALEHRQHQPGRAASGRPRSRSAATARNSAAVRRRSARCRPTRGRATGTGSSSPGDRDVDGRLEQPGLGAEAELHRRHRDPGRRGDRAHGRARVAALEEQRARRRRGSGDGCGAPALLAVRVTVHYGSTIVVKV